MGRAADPGSSGSGGSRGSGLWRAAVVFAATSAVVGVGGLALIGVGMGGESALGDRPGSGLGGSLFGLRICRCRRKFAHDPFPRQIETVTSQATRIPQ